MGVLPDYDYNTLRRTESISSLPTANSLQRFHSNVYTLRKVISVPNMHVYRAQDIFLGDRYRPRALRTLSKHDWSLFDWPYWWDRRFNYPSYLWEYLYSPQSTRRYHTKYIDPPYTASWWYPGNSYYPRYPYYRQTYLEFLDPLNWKTNRDPSYDRPWWRSNTSYRPWRYWYPYSYDVDSAVSAHRRNLVSYETLGKYYLSPYSWERNLYDIRTARYF